jgi:hypothetical protein
LIDRPLPCRGWPRIGRASVISVIIDQNRLLHLQQHASVGDRGAPHAVVVAIGSVIGDAEILASWPNCETTDATTTWTCWVVTQNALGCVRVEYQKDLYDDIAERTHRLTPSSQSAWVRPLSGVTGLRWGAFYEEQAEFDTYYPAEPLTVTFIDWETKIPEVDLPLDQRKKADQLVAAIRKSLNF